MLTVALSWTPVNTIFTLRYADLTLDRGAAGIVLDDSGGRTNVARLRLVAFAIGVCYQASNTTVRNRRIRRTKLLSDAVLACMCGAVIVGCSVNLIASLIC